MKHREGYFTSAVAASDAKVYYQSWSPAQRPQGVLVVVHGLGEHGGRYLNLVNYFVPKGFAVYALDHVGHGRSEGTRVYVERFERYVQDLRQFVEFVAEQLVDVPRVLVAHSMGALIGVAYLLSHQETVDCAIISGPAVKVPDDVSTATLAAGKILSALLPKVGILQLDAGKISRDPVVVQAYRDDPLVYNGKITARLAAEMLKTMQHVTQHAGKITLPLLILQGGEDKLVDPEGAPLLHELVSSPVNELKVYEGFFHEVFNEPEHLQVMRDVETWLSRQLRSLSPKEPVR